MKRISYLFIMIATCLQALAWGQKGHDVTAHIAEQHLTAATRAAIDSLLEGRSIVYWANWLDNASHQAPMAYTKTWHYKNVDESQRYEEAPANPAGDAVTAVKAQIETLGNPAAPLADKQLAMKILVHVAGDMHQPLHMGHATDLGGNRIKGKYFGNDTNLHTIWDTNLVESAHRWSYSEWQQQLDRLSPEAEAIVTAGTIDDWAKQAMAVASDVYVYFQPGFKASYNDVARWAPVIENQLLYGGLRLAHLLNTIFDPTYTRSR